MIGFNNRSSEDAYREQTDRLTKGPSIGFFKPCQKRFCETCKQYKPTDGTKAFKGWKCADCHAKRGEK